MQAFTRLSSLKKLRLDSCGRVRCHPDLASGMLRQLDDVSLRQCRLGNMGCLDVLLGLPKLRVSLQDLLHTPPNQLLDAGLSSLSPSP